MSSMRNAVQRRNHKERGQVSGREKWGLLEKHKVSYRGTSFGRDFQCSDLVSSQLEDYILTLTGLLASRKRLQCQEG